MPRDQTLETLPVQCTTLEVARALGLAVRSVQLMVDRGELEAWKTPGGHRRIARESVLRWARSQGLAVASAPGPAPGPASAPADAVPAGPAPRSDRARVLLIEDSVHYQNLIGLLMKQRFPALELRVAADGISGLAMVGQWQPDILLVDILLPGIDGATLIISLRSHPMFEGSQLIVVTSLDDSQRLPYAYALDGLPVVHKPRLVLELPGLIDGALARRHADAGVSRGA